MPLKFTIIKAFTTLIVVMVSLISFPLYAAPLQQSDDASTISFERCFLKGVRAASKCATVEVPVNWDDPEGQKITLSMAIVPAKGGFSEPDPFVVFAGGPGQAATDLSGLIKIAFDKINEARDVILIDQRGTGGSNKLHCDFDTATLDLGPGYVDLASMEKSMRLCATEHEKTVDIRYFTTFDALKDVEYVRQQLGIDQVNIWGGSYGTRIGLLYMKLYPTSIRSAILDGVTAPNSNLFEISTKAAQAAFTALADDCAADEACYKAFGNINATLASLLKKYRDNPEPMKFLNPLSGEWEEGIMNERLLANIVQISLYQPTRASVLPYALSEATKGNFKTLFALIIETTGFSEDSISPGLKLSVLCSEDMPRYREAEAIAAGKDSFHKDFLYNLFKAGCAGWKIRDVIDGYEDPITVDIPTLVLSGALDPITPPFSADYAVKHLPNVMHLTSAKAGHNVSVFGCAPNLMDDFVDKASFLGIDGACLNKPIRPAFLIRPQGTKP